MIFKENKNVYRQFIQTSNIKWCETLLIKLIKKSHNSGSLDKVLWRRSYPHSQNQPNKALVDK